MPIAPRSRAASSAEPSPPSDGIDPGPHRLYAYRQPWRPTHRQCRSGRLQLEDLAFDARLDAHVRAALNDGHDFGGEARAIGGRKVDLVRTEVDQDRAVRGV